MIAREFISDILTPLHPDDTIGQAVRIMSINNVKHLPVVLNDDCLGIIDEDDLLDYDNETLISSLIPSLRKVAVQSKDHLFDIIKIVASQKLSSIPVLNSDNKFLGIVAQEGLLHYYANSFSIAEPGGIIVLEMQRKDYSLSEISRIVELENAAVMSTFISEIDDNHNVILTIKINRQELSTIVRAFERYDYLVRATFSEDDYIDDLKERYDHLMNYLNV